MNRFQLHPSKSLIVSCRPILPLAICACVALMAVSARAQLAANQTNGFGNNRLVTFTYLQNFDCVDQPLLDLDFNGILAQSDPNEMQTPICQAVTEPTEDPTGGNIKHTAHLYVFVPMFSVDNDQNPADAMPCPNAGRPGELCGNALGIALIKFFGFVPEVFFPGINTVKAGIVIPAGFLLTDGNLKPITNLRSIAVSGFASTNCTGANPTPVAISGSLLNLGFGIYDYNWKTSSTFAGKCITFQANMGDGVIHALNFRFTK